MFTLGDNKESSAGYTMEYHDTKSKYFEHVVEYNDTNLVLFMVIKKQLGGSEMPYDKFQ